MSTDVAERGKIDIAKVIGGTFQVLGRNLATFSLLGLILTGIPALAITLVQAPTIRDQMANMASGEISFSSAYWAAVMMGVLASLISSAILQGALIYATVQDLNGQPASVGAALATGLRAFAPLLGVVILFFIAVTLGFILFIVPGIMLAVAWCVAAPALVADRTGVTGAFGRAAELTKGNRWSIFALFIVFWIGMFIVSSIFNLIVGVPVVGNNGMAAVEALLSPLGLAVGVIRSTLTSVIGAAGIAVLYVELRKAREGLGPQWLAEIFR